MTVNPNTCKTQALARLAGQLHWIKLDARIRPVDCGVYAGRNISSRSFRNSLPFSVGFTLTWSRVISPFTSA